MSESFEEKVSDLVADLTRQRDAAWLQTENQKTRIGELLTALEKLHRERDEAREKWKEQNETLRTLAEHGENEIQKLIKECDEARNKMADALQEVDLRTLDYERMKQERDEAREALRGILRIVESFSYSTALGKSQLERFETAKRVLETAK